MANKEQWVHMDKQGKLPGHPGITLEAGDYGVKEEELQPSGGVWGSSPPATPKAGNPIKVERRNTATGSLGITFDSGATPEVQKVDKRPSDTKSPEELKKNENVVYELLDGTHRTYIFPGAKDSNEDYVVVTDGSGNATGQLSWPEYFNRGAEIVWNPGVPVGYELCFQIMSLVDLPGSNTRKGGCLFPFCLCQLSVEQVRRLLRTTSWYVPCISDFLRKQPSKDALCAVFDILYSKGLLQVNYPFRNYYPVVAPDPFFEVTLDYWDRAYSFPVYGYNPYELPPAIPVVMWP